MEWHGKNWKKLEWKTWNGERDTALTGVVSFASRLARRPAGRLRAGGNRLVMEKRSPAR